MLPELPHGKLFISNLTCFTSQRYLTFFCQERLGLMGRVIDLCLELSPEGWWNKLVLRLQNLYYCKVRFSDFINGNNSNHSLNDLLIPLTVLVNTHFRLWAVLSNFELGFFFCCLRYIPIHIELFRASTIRIAVCLSLFYPLILNKKLLSFI
jgi:hypothetical protein